MKILILISHPAQFFFFKNTIVELRRNGHTVFILIKTKDLLSELLDELGWMYYNILPNERGKSRFNIAWSLFVRDVRLFKFAWNRNIQLFLGTDASLAHVAKILGKPCITTLEDDYWVIKHLADLTYPFTSHILVPQICDVGKWDKKKIGYNGYMKLAYLHPNWFNPDPDILAIEKEKPYYLIRLSGLSAHHDFGIKGISLELLDVIIRRLSQMGSVYISSEKRLPSKYNEYLLNIPPSVIHHYLYYAELLICDSQSMSVEAAMLGIPSIRVSSFVGKISVLDELENTYKLTFGFLPDKYELIMEKVNDLLSISGLRSQFQLRRQNMLANKIDVTAFLIWFIENYPSSATVMRENPEYHNRFKIS